MIKIKRNSKKFKKDIYSFEENPQEDNSNELSIDNRIQSH